MKTCPHCGGELPRPKATPKPPKYATAEARKLALQVGDTAATQRRAQRDRREVYPALRKLGQFGSAQVGEALRAAGRHYSEHSAVLNRGVMRGWIRLVGQKHRGRRLVRVFEITDVGAALDQ
jgi:hypothetical protein